mgnify:FL=1
MTKENGSGPVDQKIRDIKAEFLTVRPEDYKNPDMFDLEPAYLKTTDYDRTKLTPLKWRRKISELALRLGRAAKKEPERLGGKDPGKKFTTKN